MTKPDIISSFTYNERHVEVEWYDVTDKERLPNLQWQQIYAIGNLEGLVPVVQYANDIENLPGGKVEPGETVGHALAREMEEELNCRLLEWQPLGYQKCLEAGHPDLYQLRVYAKLQKIGEFTNDPGGLVVGNTYVPLGTLNDTISYGEVGDRLVNLAAPYFEKK